MRRCAAGPPEMTGPGPAEHTRCLITARSAPAGTSRPLAGHRVPRPTVGLYAAARQVNAGSRELQPPPRGGAL